MKTKSDCEINKEFTHLSHFGDQQEELRRGPWTLEEDTLLSHHVACHGDGHWNLLAKSAGLKRTGKSCRLRWLNYLKPDIKRGNLSPQEQLLILELHSKWGNRWSKIAAELPGRTDNEIKNYWRTRVQKQAKKLNMECNSQSFIDAIKCYYMPILIQKIEQNSTNSTVSPPSKASPSKLSELPTNVPEKTVCANTIDDYYCSLHSCDYDMDLAYTSASGLTDCHVLDDNWWGDDDCMWDLDELWQFRK